MDFLMTERYSDCQDSHMRTTIRIDDDLYQRATARAALRGITVDQLIEDAVRLALRPGQQASFIGELPVFGGSGTLPGVDLGDPQSRRDLMGEGGDLGGYSSPENPGE